MRYKKLHKQKSQTAKKAPKQNFYPFISVDFATNKALFDSLWQKGEYAELERMLKAQKQGMTGRLIENLSKLAFFQHERKMTGTGTAFVSHILTGGACLIARNKMYHDDIADEIRLLANEIKLIFTQAKIKNKHTLAWDQPLFDIFIDFEANVLIEVLQIAVKNKELNIEFIPSPNYWAIYQVANKPLGQQFLRWLAVESPALSQMYHMDICHAAFWALSGESLSDINSTLKSANINTFHPYLCLALMLRSANMKKSLVKDIVQLSDFENLKETSSVGKSVAIQTVKNMLSEESKSKLPPAFWELLLDFYPVLEEPELKEILITKLINNLQAKHKARMDLGLNALKNFASRINAHELVTAIDTLCQRQLICSQLMKVLENEKQSKKSHFLRRVLN